MRVLLWSFLSAVIGLLTCITIGCGRKASPVAQNAPVPPRVAESPRSPVPRDLRPVRNPENDPDAVADFDFGGPPRKDVPQPLDFDPQPPPSQPEPMRPRQPVMEEEEEPRKPQPPAKFEPRKNDPLRGIAPKPDDVPAAGVPVAEPPKVEGPKVAQPERRFENMQPVPAQPIQPTMPVDRRPVAEQDLKDIHLFVDTRSLASGRMPDPTTIQAALLASGSPAAKWVATGDIILTGAGQRESCWAYQKGATTDGGWIVTNSGPEQVDAATAKRWIGGR